MSDERDNANSNIYAQMWDSYVLEWLQLYDSGQLRGDLVWPGDEWGDTALWDSWFDTLFVPAGVGTWKRVVEIGPGSGKYTLRVLTKSHAEVRGYDVSERFMEVCQRRCAEWLNQDRLSLHLLEGNQPDELLVDLEEAGWRRKVDALFSLDSMVHVDLQYLIVYLVTASRTLRLGGALILSLADATSDAGFTYMLENIAWTYPRQGLPSGKFEWLSPGLIMSVLQRLGFEVVHISNTPRDLLLVASLVNPMASSSLEHYLRS
jgi:cyclopropane fatty-acyl-phospholipid synthase-like methyltransferase